MLKTNKKGMGIQQVFVFIVAAITFSMIMIFGYGAINDFLAKGEQVEFYQFKTSLESSIKKIYSEYGAERQVDFNIPVKYSQICFVDLDSDANSVEFQAGFQDLCNKDPDTENDDWNFKACDSWETASNSGLGYEGAEENVFLEPGSPVSLKVYKIEIANDQLGNERGFLCVPIEKGKFSLHLKGKGSRTEISERVFSLPST